ncbi:MAG TPA: hypothetical protein VGW10_00325 [Solirubrobacteraceae bacterium]|nr:hypothetical protein [Solirubrobacteraceae bacterium]
MAASETCGPDSAGIDGYEFNDYFKLTAQRDPANPKTTWICYRARTTRGSAQTGGIDRGGRIDVTDATVSPTLPSVDNRGTDCTTTVPNAFPGPRPLADGQVGGNPGDPTYTPFLIDAYLAPFHLWGCVQAGPLSARVKVATSGIAAPVVTSTPDAPGTALPVQKQGPFGYPSNKCLENAWHVRVVNMRIQNAHVWLYHWPESPTRTAVCMRVEREGQQPIGYRVYVDTNNAPGVTPVVESSTDTAPCTFPIAQVNNPVEVRLATSPRGANPASICAEVGALKQRITVGTTGTLAPPLVDKVKDPDSV